MRSPQMLTRLLYLTTFSLRTFNSSVPPLTQANSQRFMVTPSAIPPETIFATEEVTGILFALDTSKASGHDGISGKNA